MREVFAITKRELKNYFTTPMAYIFMMIFVILCGVFTFYVGGFFDRSQADLQSFFVFHPWIYLMLIPAVSMRLWAEERKNGTIELIMTLPISTFTIICGKFLASWAFMAICLFLTFPIWVTVNVLGSPDNGVIIANYGASFLMAGAFLSIGGATSALTKSQITAFALSIITCFLFLLSGMRPFIKFISDWAPDIAVRIISSFSFLTHFNSITRGVIDLRDVLFFVSFIVFWLFANLIIVDFKKSS